MSTSTTPPAITPPPYSSPLATGSIGSSKATAAVPSTISGVNATSILQGPYPTVSSAYCGSMPVAELTGYNNPSQCGYINSGPQFGDLVQNGVILNDTFNFNTTGPSFPIELSWTCNNFACSYPVSLRSFHCEDGCDGIHDVVDGLAGKRSNCTKHWKVLSCMQRHSRPMPSSTISLVSLHASKLKLHVC